MSRAQALVAATPPDTDGAARELSRELWNPVYAGTWWDRFKAWVAEGLLTRSGEASMNLLAYIVLGLVLIGAAALVWSVIRRSRATTATPPAPEPGLFGEPAALSADEYRARAVEHADQGRLDEAALDRYRAMAADAVTTGVVAASPDLTAHEVGAALAHAHPDLADGIRRSEGLFDLVLYGGGHAAPDDLDVVVRTDDALQGRTPRRSGPAPVPAVPR